MPEPVYQATASAWDTLLGLVLNRYESLIPCVPPPRGPPAPTCLPGRPPERHLAQERMALYAYVAEHLGDPVDRGISRTHPAVIPVLPAGAGRFGGRVRGRNRRAPAPGFRAGTTGPRGRQAAQAGGAVGARRGGEPDAGPEAVAVKQAAEAGGALPQHAEAARSPGLRRGAGRRSAQPAGRPAAGAGLFTAGAVGDGQQRGHGQDQPVPGHAHEVRAVRAAPLPAAPPGPRKPCSIQWRQAQGRPRCAPAGCRSAGPRAPRNPGRAAQSACRAGDPPRRPRPPHPKRARSAAQRPHRHPGAAGWAEGDVRRVAQDGMPAQLPDPCPQVAAVQPPVAEDVHRHPGRHRRGRQPQPAPVVGDPGFRRVGPHHVPGHQDRLPAWTTLTASATHSSRWCVGSRARIRDGSVAESPSPGVHRSSTQRSSSGRPPRPPPCPAPRSGCGRHRHRSTPAVPGAGFRSPRASRGRRRRVQAAVVGQNGALHPQGQVPPQAALKRGQVPLGSRDRAYHEAVRSMAVRRGLVGA